MAPPRAKPLVIAHRGSSASYAEQTVGAFRAALAERADLLECDLRLTADGQLVTIHDRTVDRTSNGTGSVSRMTLAQLRALDFGSWKYTAPGGDRSLANTPENCRIATFRDVLDLAVACGREVGIAAETKHPTKFVGAVEHAVAKVLGEYGLGGVPGTGRPWVHLMSFSPLAVRRFALVRPDVPVVQLIDADQPVPFALRTVPKVAPIVGLDVRIVRSAPQVVAEQKSVGRKVYVWTVDEPDEVDLLVDLGVDGIITNRPGPVAEQVRRAGPPDT